MFRTEAFLSAVNSCPTPGHIIAFAESRLLKKGFVRVFEDALPETRPDKFFVVRGDSTIAIFDIHDTSRGIFMTSHLDFPGISLKPNTQIASRDLDQLAISTSVSTQFSTWYDQELGIAGSVWVRKDGKIIKKLIATQNPVCVIPSNRQIIGNNIETNFRPIIAFASSFDSAQVGQSPALMAVLAKEAECNVDDIIDFEISLIDSRKAELIGAKKDMLAGQGVDALTSTFGGLLSFFEAGECTSGFRVFVGYGGKFKGGKNSSLGTLITAMTQWAGIKPHALSRSMTICLENSNELLPAHPIRLQRPAAGMTPGSGPVLQQCRGRPAVTDVDGEAHIMEIAKEADIKLNRFIDVIPWTAAEKPAMGMTLQLGIPFVILGMTVMSRHSIRSYALLKDFIEFKDLAKKIWQVWNTREPIQDIE